MRSARTIGVALVATWLAAQAPARAASPTVAVLYFDYSGKDEQLQVLKKGLAQMLITDLSSVSAVRIVERDRLQEILDELKLAQTAKVDAATAAKIGKLLGARYLVLGGYFDLMGALRADARVVEVETGRVVQSVGANGKPDDFLTVEQKLSTDLGKVLSTQLASAATPEPPAPSTATATASHKLALAHPAKLSTKTALRYARALDAKDKGDKATAKKELQAVVQEQPDFKLAAADLDRLMQ